MNETSEMEKLGFDPEDSRKWYFVHSKGKPVHVVFPENVERELAGKMLNIAADLQPGSKTEVRAIGNNCGGEFVIVFGRVPKFGMASRLRMAVEKATGGRWTAGKYQYPMLISRYGYRAA